MGHAGLGLGLLQLQAGTRGSRGTSAHHSSAQTQGLQVRGRRVTQESKGQLGAGRVSFSGPAEFRGSGRPTAPWSSGKLEPSVPFKFEANFADAADSTDGRGSNRKQLQEQREDCSSPE